MPSQTVAGIVLGDDEQRVLTFLWGNKGQKWWEVTALWGDRRETTLDLLLTKGLAECKKDHEERGDRLVDWAALTRRGRRVARFVYESHGLPDPK